MFCNYSKSRRSVRWALLLTVAVFSFLLYRGTAASAATVSSPKPNTLFVTANVPTSFNNSLCIILNEASTGKTLTLKFDCTSNLSTNAQLPNGTYKVLGAYAERHSDHYEVSCDVIKFTIGDGSSPTLALTVQTHTQNSQTTSAAPADGSEDVPSDTSTETPGNEISEEFSENLTSSNETDNLTVDLTQPEETTPSGNESSPAENESDDNPSSTNILKTLFRVILGLFISVLLFSVAGVISYFLRNRH